MRFLRIIVAIIFCVSAGLSGYLYFSHHEDNTYPEIICKYDEIKASVKITEKELLSYVTASDAVDGDITDKIVVESISQFIADSTVKVIFAVSDSNNHVTKLEKKMIYTDYVHPRLKLSDDLIYPPTASVVNFTSSISALDVIDGDISGRLIVVYSNFEAGKSGSYPVTFQFSNLNGDIQTLTLNAIVSEYAASSTQINLTDYITYTKVGQEVNYRSFIDKISNSVVSSSDSIFGVSDVRINSGTVNINEPGVYDVTYRIVSGGSTVAMTRLVVVVTE